MAFNGDGPHTKRQRTDTDPTSNRVSTRRQFKGALPRGGPRVNSDSHPHELFSLIKSRLSEERPFLLVCCGICFAAVADGSVSMSRCDALDQLFSRCVVCQSVIQLLPSCLLRPMTQQG